MPTSQSIDQKILEDKKTAGNPLLCTKLQSMERTVEIGTDNLISLFRSAVPSHQER